MEVTLNPNNYNVSLLQNNTKTKFVNNLKNLYEFKPLLLYKYTYILCENYKVKKNKK